MTRGIVISVLKDVFMFADDCGMNDNLVAGFAVDRSSFGAKTVIDKTLLVVSGGAASGLHTIESYSGKPAMNKARRHG